jgi:hypothetical protein
MVFNRWPSIDLIARDSQRRLDNQAVLSTSTVETIQKLCIEELIKTLRGGKCSLFIMRMYTRE